MKFIVKDKIYDTEKAEKIIEYRKKFKDKFIGFYFYRQTILYKTNKNNWFSVSDTDYKKHIISENTVSEVKEILININDINKYEKYFGILTEA